jgi:hypothetical protein
MIIVKTSDSILYKMEMEGKRVRWQRDREKESVCERQRMVEKER